MEAIGAFLEEEWESLSSMFCTEEPDFMAHLHGLIMRDNSFIFGNSSIVGPVDEAIVNSSSVEENTDSSFDTYSNNFHYFSQESSNSSIYNSLHFPIPSQETHYFSDGNPIQETSNILESIDFCAVDEANNLSIPNFADNVMDDVLCLKEEMKSEKFENADAQPATVADPGKALPPKRKLDAPQPHAGTGNKSNGSLEAPMKKSRVPRDAQKGKRKATLKKNTKLTPDGCGEEESNAGENGPSSGCYCSEDESNATDQELNGGATSDSRDSLALNSTEKTRAGRGAATDPQSLYARKRRDRINERLRILQNLVPNGTKVDISTMLEEAVKYVKFLQLQIKLLSSDDLWMYSPIAYNGMDTGLYSKISPTL